MGFRVFRLFFVGVERLPQRLEQLMHPAQPAVQIQPAQQALEHCSQSILTSGLTFFAATFGVAAISKVELLKSICMLISRGALISMVVILLVLPAGLMLLDGLICRTTYHWLNAPNAAKE